MKYRKTREILLFIFLLLSKVVQIFASSTQLIIMQFLYLFSESAKQASCALGVPCIGGEG